MTTLIEIFNNLTSPEWIMLHGGLYFVLFIVFAETGLLVGFFLPGDSLLFITGMIIANTVLPEGNSTWYVLYWILLIAIAGIVGNYLGYWIGHLSGDMLMRRKDNWLYKKKYLTNAHRFYEQKGGSAIIIARFLPVVRTFAPIVAGIAKMNMMKFTAYNIIGSFAWVGSLVGAGYVLGENEWVKENIDKIILLIVVLSTAPVVLKFVMKKKEGVEVLEQ